MAKFSRLMWKEVETAAEAAFSVWQHQTEIYYAKRGWNQLLKVGVGTYDSELQKTKSALEFITFASVFNDFCYHAWELSPNNDYDEWASLLALRDIEIGYLAGVASILDENDYEELDRVELIRLLCNSYRPHITRKMIEGAGDIHVLFEDLMLSRLGRRPTEDERVEMWELSDDVMIAWNWVEQGFEPVNV